MYGFSGRSNKNSYKGNYTTSQPSIIEYIQNPNIQYPAKFFVANRNYYSNKDTKDEIGFFYTLPEIIASMDLIKE